MADVRRQVQQQVHRVVRGEQQDAQVRLAAAQLDAEGDAKTMGKPANQDGKKATFVTAMGAAQARARAEMLVDQAVSHLRVFDANRVELLKDLGYYVLQRRL